MKKFSLVILSILFLAAAPVFSEEYIPVAGEVDIYPSGARLYLDIDVEDEFALELPGTLDRDSIYYVGNESVPVDRFVVLEESRTGWIPPSLRELDSRISNLREERSKLESELAGLKQTIAYLDNLKPGSPDVGNFMDFVGDLQEKRISIEISISEKQANLEKLNREIKILVDEFNNRKPQDRNRVILIQGKAFGKGKLRISVWTSHSRWTPIHNMDLNTQDKTVHSFLKAQVIQKSGIDWKGELIFHTVQPKRSVSTPQTDPLIVDYRREARKLDMVLSDNMVRTEKAASVPQAIQISETMTDLAISVKAKVSGTGNMTEINMGKMEIPGEIDMIALPYLSDETWVVQKVKALEAPIIPGRVNLFIDGESSGKTSIREYARGEEFTMAFGRSPMVKVKREKIVPLKGSTWVGKGTLEEGYTITVTNGLETDTEVTVNDRLPLSVQEKIKVTLTEIEPEPDERSEEEILTWNISLKRGETRQIKVLYRIKYPSDKEIVFH